MEEAPRKKVNESWKEQVEHEKQRLAAGTDATDATQPQVEKAKQARPQELPEARFDLFVSGLAMDALIALGDAAHPTTRKQAMNLPQARYLIDLIGILQEKTRGNLTVEEGQLLSDMLYQLRMRYLAKAGG